ncbi:hypothetical protein HELRODRAFT_162835 [Helobdella robusta]|uniref:Uncharacterized protein n=1 Tax=Helobdella robusta TaxID=6412 RepID=T1ET88_HELRO|nr:hypothetical protein HELRODRAFT_162835 [Helobdella robusta]ESN99314.1 hypothetical protein HELRODRAFT_162835 [Helobdella robusta]
MVILISNNINHREENAVLRTNLAINWRDKQKRVDELERRHKQELDKISQELADKNKNGTPNHVSAKTLKAPTFDGIIPWESYRTQFEAAALRSALEVLQAIPAKDKDNFESLTAALTRRFGNSYTEDFFSTQLEHRVQKSGETAQQLAQDVERLTLLAYPTETPEFRDKLAAKAFIQAIRNPEIKYELAISKEETLQDGNGPGYLLHSEVLELWKKWHIRRYCQQLQKKGNFGGNKGSKSKNEPADKAPTAKTYSDSCTNKKLALGIRQGDSTTSPISVIALIRYSTIPSKNRSTVSKVDIAYREDLSSIAKRTRKINV